MGRRIFCCAALVLCRIAFAQELSPAQKQLNIDSFERIWATVSDTHWDPKLGGLDWKAVHDELRPSIEKAETMAQARKVMRDMLGRLQQSHFSLLPAEVYREVGDKSGVSIGEEGRTGIEVRVVNGQALVTSVESGSPAAKAGVHAGLQILRIRGAELASSITNVDETYQRSTLREMMLERSVAAKLSGEVGDKVAVQFRTAAGRLSIWGSRSRRREA